MYFRQQAIKEAHRSNANLREPRWRGIEANNNTAPPREDNGKAVEVYAECIDPKWAERSSANARVLENAPASPASWTIWLLKIRSEHLYEDDQSEFADDEDEGEVLGL